MFTTILDADRRPALFHCTTGKDRTGWAAAATLTLLGVSEENVLADFMITNRDLRPALKPHFDQFAAAGGDPALLRPVLGVEANYLLASFDEMQTRFGTIADYFSQGSASTPTTKRRCTRYSSSSRCARTRSLRTLRPS
jgi:protein-tyrosine phosphatase